MIQQCSCKPGTRPRWFFRWWLTFSSLQKPENWPISTFQYISGPSQLSLTTTHSWTILTFIRTINHSSSFVNYMQFIAKMFRNWPLLPPPWEMGVGEHGCCVQIWIFHLIPSKQFIFVRWPSFTHMRSGDWQTWHFCVYLDISFNF